MCFSCKNLKTDLFIVFWNNSDQPISVFIATPDWAGFTYPDTILPMNSISMLQIVEQGYNRITPAGDIDFYFSALPNDTASIYFFSTDTLEKYSWEEIRAGYMVLERRDVAMPEGLSDPHHWDIYYP